LNNKKFYPIHPQLIFKKQQKEEEEIKLSSILILIVLSKYSILFNISKLHI